MIQRLQELERSHGIIAPKIRRTRRTPAQMEKVNRRLWAVRERREAERAEAKVVKAAKLKAKAELRCRRIEEAEKRRVWMESPAGIAVMEASEREAFLKHIKTLKWYKCLMEDREREMSSPLDDDGLMELWNAENDKKREIRALAAEKIELRYRLTEFCKDMGKFWGKSVPEDVRDLEVVEWKKDAKFPIAERYRRRERRMLARLASGVWDEKMVEKQRIAWGRVTRANSQNCLFARACSGCKNRKGNKLFCNDECTNAYYGNRVVRTCFQCKKRFFPDEDGQVHCSPECWERYYKKRGVVVDEEED